MTRLNIVSQELTLDEYCGLAEFRRQVWCFENVTEQHTAQFDINLDSYSLLLAIQGLPEGVRPTVDALAERMCLSREQTGQLIASCVDHGDVARSLPDSVAAADWVKLTRNGREALRSMSLANRDELERAEPEISRSLQAVLKQRRGKARRSPTLRIATAGTDL